MAHINEDLIHLVFDEIIKYRPTFSKYLIVDEDEEEIDFRILGDLIIKNYPWPLGVELRRLFSGSMRILNRMRLDQIFKTIERAMQFVSFTMISQLVMDKAKNKIQIPESFLLEFERRFSVLSLGNFTWLIRALGNLYKEQNLEWFMHELSDNFDKKFYNDLDFWVPERNEIGHYQINLTQEEIEKRCVEYEDKLKNILVKIAFISKYKLISVREIQVYKIKNHPPIFHHVIDILNSSDSDFKGKELNEDKFTESHSVLLMKSIKSVEEYLNLSPLIIDTNSEVIDDKEKFDIKKDIFMYTKYRSGHLMYVGTEVTEKCDLRSLSNYQLLVDQFEEMMQIILN